MEQWVFLLIIVFLGAFVLGMTGFGVGIFMMLFFPAVFGYQMSVGITAICCEIMNAVLFWKLRRLIEFKKILPMLIPLLLIQIVSTQFLFVLSSEVLDLIFGVILLAFAGLFVLSAVRWQIKESTPHSILAGTAAGICGILSICGPPLGYYCHSIFSDNDKYMANLQAMFLPSGVIMIIQHVINGNITGAVLQYSLVSGVLCLVALPLALKLFRKLNRQKLTIVIIVFLVVMGVVKLFF